MNKKITKKSKKPKSNLGNLGVKRLIRIKNKEPIEIYDRIAPYASDGLITPEGWFLQCDPLQHVIFVHHILNSNTLELEQLGWVFVWSYKSMFDKKTTSLLNLTPYIRFSDGAKRLTIEQRATILKWCDSRKVTLKRALTYNYEDFTKEDIND